jgi:hypothetical protein
MASVPAGTGIAIPADDALILRAVDAAGPDDAAAWAWCEAGAWREAGAVLRDHTGRASEGVEDFTRLFAGHLARLRQGRLRHYEALGLIARR